MTLHKTLKTLEHERKYFGHRAEHQVSWQLVSAIVSTIPPRNKDTFIPISGLCALHDYLLHSDTPTCDQTVGVPTNEDISNLMLALEKMVGHNDMLAYLTMMAVRIIELRRVLKKTGSIYLHCDPTASHYLKIVLDVVFGKKNFKSEIVWKRTNNPKGSQFKAKKFGQVTDVIFFYTKTDK